MIDIDLMKQIEETREKHEFLTFLIIKDHKGGPPTWRCGVVQHCNNRFITFYDFGKVRNERDRQTFLEYSDRWWWESGMALPVDYYTGKDFDIFQDALTTIPRKTLEIDPIGPTYSLADHYLKRVKKRKIDLVTRKRM